MPAAHQAACQREFPANWAIHERVGVAPTEFAWPGPGGHRTSGPPVLSLFAVNTTVDAIAGDVPASFVIVGAAGDVEGRYRESRRVLAGKIG